MAQAAARPPWAAQAAARRWEARSAGGEAGAAQQRRRPCQGPCAGAPAMGDTSSSRVMGGKVGGKEGRQQPGHEQQPGHGRHGWLEGSVTFSCNFFSMLVVVGIFSWSRIFFMHRMDPKSTYLLKIKHLICCCSCKIILLYYLIPHVEGHQRRKRPPHLRQALCLQMMKHQHAL